MSLNRQEYTLNDGRIIAVVYDNYNICRVTKECMELLISLYEQGREDERAKVLEEFANWYRSKGYSAYDIGLLIREYIKEQK